MKSHVFLFLVVVAACATLPARAALTVTATNGVESLTLTFDAAADVRELWCAWDDADKGAGFADWAESERVAIVAADETALTVALPNDARRAAYARFFLFEGGASYPCAFIRGTGTQYLNTGYFATPKTSIGMEFELEDLFTVQQIVFGSEGSTSIVRAYINGNGLWAWAFIDGATGNWKSSDVPFDHRRTLITLDGYNDLYSISVDGVAVHSEAISAAVADTKRTATCDVPIYLLASRNTQGGDVGQIMKAKFYGATIDEEGVRQHTYVPYVSAGVAGAYDSVADAFLGNVGTGEFVPGGRGGDVSGAEAGEALDLDAVRGGSAGPETVYVNVGKTKTVVFDGPATIDYRLVKIGEGTLVLEGTRTFNHDVIISNGILRANWATSGLAGTHLGICNAGSNANLCYFQETSDSFTASVAASGPGTVELYGYSGVIPFQQDLTVNFGGDGRTVTRGANGFNTTSFWLTHSSSTNSTTFVNNIDFAGLNLESKGSGSGTAFYTGYITNSTSTTAGVWNFWGGNIVLVGSNGGRTRDVYGYQVNNHASTLIFSNATIEVTHDFLAGADNNQVSHTTLVNCRRYAQSANWDFISGAAGTTLVIDGGSFERPNAYMIVGYTSNRKGTCTVTNDAVVSSQQIRTYPDGCFRQCGGTSSFLRLIQYGGLVELHGGRMNLTSGEQHVGSSSPQGPSTFAMYGGTLYVSDGQNMQIGSYSKGWFHQEGGEVSVPNYFAVGRYAAGDGRLDVHGGTFTHRNQGAIRIGEDGTGTVSVANGGTFVDLAGNSPMSANAKGVGTLFLSPDGVFETPQLKAGAAGRDNGVVFNGGTLKLRTNGSPSAFLDSTLTRVTVSPYGGAIDTNGKGDFTLNRALGPTTDAGDLSEALAHRWSFKGGSLVDSVGGLTATVGGTVDLEDGAVRLKGTSRGTSCVNLGTDLLPTDGRGATIEVWVTPLSFKSWARVIDFGPGSEGTGKDLYFSFNDGNNTAEARAHFRTINATLNCYIPSAAIAPGRTYHIALVFAPQPDRKMLCTAYIRDADTGDLLNTGSGTQALDWTLGDIPQTNGCWLGHSSYASNNDPDARYHEVRIHHRPMSAAQAEASCLAGPDAVYYFRKKGAGTLTMTGANTYTTGTAVDGGTLKLASGATLPATEMWAGSGATLDLNGTLQTARELGGTGTVKGGTLAVTDTIQPGGRKTVGTLTVDGTSLTSGTLVVDTGADGTCDCLAATGTLDLSNLSLALSDVTALDETKIYTIATAPSFTGSFAGVTLPNRKWRVSVADTKVKLVYANGTVLYFR